MPILVLAASPLVGSGPQVRDVGPFYDLLLSTRDGSTLPCRNKDGVIINLSKVGFMSSISPQGQGQHEETELQHKDQLVQLSSPNLIDREFDQWPQVSQGDWSGGTGQRVFTGATPLTGGTESDPTRYWDGLGVIWPINDYLPQQAVLANPDNTAEGGAVMQSLGVGVAAGSFATFGVGAFAPAYAYSYMQQNAPQHNILAIQTLANLRKIDPIPGSVNGTRFDPSNFNGMDYCFAGSTLWVVTVPASTPNTVTVTGYGDGSPPAILTTVTYTGTFSNGVPRPRVAVARVGNVTIVAVLYLIFAGLQPAVRLFTIQGSGGGLSTTAGAFADVSIGDNQLYTSFLQMDFLGETLLLASVTGDKGVISQYNISSNTWTTLVTIPNSTNILFCVVAGSIFILAGNDSAASGFGDTVDMYLLQGGSLQHIGPVQIQANGTSFSNSIAGELEPQAIGPYAVFGIYYRPASQSTTSLQVFAYDVLRGKLFKVQDIGGYFILLRPDTGGRRMGVSGAQQRPTPVGTLSAQWMVSVPTLSGFASSQDVTNAQNMLVAPSTTNFGTPFLRAGVQIVSSLIDFTSAQLKLFRQLVVSWNEPGLPNDSGISVRLDVWLDQDPDALNLIPDFTTSVVGGVATQGQTQLKLTINQIAHKLVYRVTTVGPSVSGNGAVKLKSAVVRAATGWVQMYKLDLSPQVQLNSKNGNVWEHQSVAHGPMVDCVAAYNFIRQLWRLQGGECLAVFPNGDVGNWLIQDVHFDSPKPVAASFRADQQTVYQTVATMKLREDI